MHGIVFALFGFAAAVANDYLMFDIINGPLVYEMDRNGTRSVVQFANCADGLNVKSLTGALGCNATAFVAWICQPNEV